VARAAAVEHPDHAFVDLGLALQAALPGHDETFRLLEGTPPMLPCLGGAQLLEEVAAAIDELDSW
jgi:hypothetical protein